MERPIGVDAPRAFETSQAVGERADELRAELTRRSHEWDAVVSGWSGAAASSYAARQDDWHTGAAELVEATHVDCAVSDASRRCDV